MATNQKPLTQEKAIEHWTELQRLISVGAYEERSAEHHEAGTYPEDGVEESVANLETWAARQGIEFHWHQDSQTWSLEPMGAESKVAFLYATVEVGDFLEHRGLSTRERLGPVEIYEERGRPIFLVPGKRIEKVAVQPHRILAVLRNGQEIARFTAEGE